MMSMLMEEPSLPAFLQSLSAQELFALLVTCCCSLLWMLYAIFRLTQYALTTTRGLVAYNVQFLWRSCAVAFLLCAIVAILVEESTAAHKLYTMNRMIFLLQLPVFGIWYVGLVVVTRLIRWRYTVSRRFWKLLLALTAAVVQSDLKIRESKRQNGMLFLKETFGVVDPAWLMRCQTRWTQLLSQQAPNQKQVASVCRSLRWGSNYALRLVTFAFLYEYALVDGEISQQEIEMLQHIAQELHLKPEDIRGLLLSLEEHHAVRSHAKAAAQLEQLPSIFGVRKEASLEEIEQRFQQLNAWFRPEDFARFGSTIVRTVQFKQKDYQHVHRALSRQLKRSVGAGCTKS